MIGLTVSMDTLRDWLDQGRPVTVLDVRPSEQYAEWAIPGSVHIDQYEALKANDPGALSGLRIPQGRPVVTVCAMGRTSAIAAQQLRDRGFEALSLAGGMKAWSCAWNTAEINLGSGSVHVIQVRRTGKGCLSYVIGSRDQAAVIDASLAPEVYLDLASRSRWRREAIFSRMITQLHMKEMRDLLEQRLRHEVTDVRVNGHPEQRLPNTLSISFHGLDAAALLNAVAPCVAASAGAACHSGGLHLSHVLKAMDLPVEWAQGTVRLSTGRMTTHADIERAAQDIAESVVRMRRPSTGPQGSKP